MRQFILNLLHFTFYFLPFTFYFFTSLIFDPFLYAQEQKADDSFRELFTEAGYHVEYKNYLLALPVYLTLDSMQPDNANIYYRIGLCYMNLPSGKKGAIPWLEKAIKKTTREWDDLSYLENKAPMDAFMLLGRAYHLNYQLDTAVRTFNKVKSLYSAKHYMQEEADYYIGQCNTAIELMRDSLSVTIENLGEAINSPWPDYCPVITADESILIFTSRRDNTTGGTTELDGRYMEDVYVSMNSEGMWSHAAQIGTSINTADHDAAIGLSHDGQLLFLYRDDDGDGNIYQSELMGDIWTIPEKMSSNINSPSWEAHASLSADGLTIYFVSDRKGGFGGRDIWRCKKLPDGEWSLPLNLGEVINTKYDEDGPFIQADGFTLYFSSKGHKTMGGFDVFYSELGENDVWSKPVNIGYPINTVDDDIYLVLSADGKRAYFSSLRGGGAGDKDIYKSTFTLKEAARLTVLKGVMSVTDAEGNPVSTRIGVTDNATGTELIYFPNSKTGKFLVILPSGKDYTINYYANEEEVRSDNLFIPEGTEYREMEQPFDLKPVTLSGEVKDTAKSGAPETTATSTSQATQTTQTAQTTQVSPTDVKKDINAISQAEPPSELESFEQHFGYNVKEIQSSSVEFTTFVNNIVGYYNQKGSVRIIIDASASKVPTTTYKTNQHLARLRGENARDVLLPALKEKGVDVSKVNVNIIPKVLGPEFKGDHIEKRETYEKYQYVKIRVP